MSQKYLIRDIYDVETDAADWPKGIGDEEKAALQEHVLAALRAAKSPLSTYVLVEQVKRLARADERCPATKSAAVIDWIYGAVVRAARAADCEPLWHAPPTVDEAVEEAVAGPKRTRRKLQPATPHIPGVRRLDEK